VPRRSEPTVFVVDDEPDVCRAIGQLLRADGFRCRIFTDPAAFLQAIRPDARGCILLDMRMPRLSGLEVQERLLRRGSLQPIIFVSGHGDIPIALRAVRAGALDFVEKPFRADDLLELVRQGVALDERRRAEGSGRDEAARRVAALTRREREVADAVADGESSAEIAARLGLSPRTVEMHRARAMKALGVKGAAEMIRLVLGSRAGFAPGTGTTPRQARPGRDR